MAIRIFFVDDERLLLDSLSVFFSLDSDFQVVGSASTGEEALNKLEEVAADVLLVDLNMAGMGGVQLIRRVKQRWPKLRMLVLSTYYDDRNVSDALAAGADGYILKTFSSSEIVEAARMVASGHTVLDEKVMSVLHQKANRFRYEDTKSRPSEQEEFRRLYTELTERERDICRLIQEGRSNREIAAELHITEGTVKNYLSAIYNTLGVRDRTALAVALTRTNL